MEKGNVYLTKYVYNAIIAKFVLIESQKNFKSKLLRSKVFGP